MNTSRVAKPAKAYDPDPWRNREIQHAYQAALSARRRYWRRLIQHTGDE